LPFLYTGRRGSARVFLCTELLQELRPVPNNKSTYLETGVINLLRGLPFTPPTLIYVALYTVMSSDRSQGGTEVSPGIGYVRQSVAFGAPTYNVDGSARVSNLAQVLFPRATATWGSIIGFGLYDNITGGHLLYFGALTSSLIVLGGEDVLFDAGVLTVSES
jgi:hypothetical protein